jgi:hypothetical protein
VDTGSNPPLVRGCAEDQKHVGVLGPPGLSGPADRFDCMVFSWR